MKFTSLLFYYQGEISDPYFVYLVFFFDGTIAATTS